MEQITELPYSTLGVVWLVLVVAFGAVYFALDTVAPAHAPAPLGAHSALERFFNAIYFSVVTSTTVGYGDILPFGFSRVLAGIQSILAFFVFGVCISKLVANKQEMALRQVHRISFEDVFHNLREGLYIVRKDIDHAIAAAEQNRALSEHAWDNLSVAFRQTEALLKEIPDFYSDAGYLYRIDPIREDLLHEAVQRTLHRINQLLDALGGAGIPWASRSSFFRQLDSLVRSARDVMGLWRERVPGERTEAFEDILRLHAILHERIAAVTRAKASR